MYVSSIMPKVFIKYILLLTTLSFQLSVHWQTQWGGSMLYCSDSLCNTLGSYSIATDVWMCSSGVLYMSLTTAVTSLTHHVIHHTICHLPGVSDCTPHVYYIKPNVTLVGLVNSVISCKYACTHSWGTPDPLVWSSLKCTQTRSLC